MAKKLNPCHSEGRKVEFSTSRWFLGRCSSLGRRIETQEVALECLDSGLSNEWLWAKIGACQLNQGSFKVEKSDFQFLVKKATFIVKV